MSVVLAGRVAMARHPGLTMADVRAWWEAQQGCEGEVDSVARARHPVLTMAEVSIWGRLSRARGV